MMVIDHQSVKLSFPQCDWLRLDYDQGDRWHSNSEKLEPRHNIGVTNSKYGWISPTLTRSLTLLSRSQLSRKWYFFVSLVKQAITKSQNSPHFCGNLIKDCIIHHQFYFCHNATEEGLMRTRWWMIRNASILVLRCRYQLILLPNNSLPKCRYRSTRNSFCLYWTVNTPRASHWDHSHCPILFNNCGILQACKISLGICKQKLLLLNHAAVTFKSTQYLYFLFSWIWSAGLYNRHSDDHCLVSGCPDDDVSTPDVSSWLLPDTVQISDSPHRPRHCRHHTLTDINAVVSSRAWFTHTVAVTSFQSK